jgi:hypothetical protein
MRTLLLTTVLFSTLFLDLSPLQSSEIGFFFGPYSKAGDIVKPVWITWSDYYTQAPFLVLNRDIADRQSIYSNKIGERSTAAYFGFDWLHGFPFPGFEVEHTLGLVLGAGMSAKPNTLIYSLNLNYLLSLFPQRFLWGSKPFISGGAGLVYSFGANFGKYYNEQTFVPPSLDFPSIIGNHGNIQCNFGIGVKRKVWEGGWLRFSLKDYVLPSEKRLTYNFNNISQGWSVVKGTTHNIAFTIALVFLRE